MVCRMWTDCYWVTFPGYIFFFSSRRRHTRWTGDWSSDVCSYDLGAAARARVPGPGRRERAVRRRARRPAPDRKSVVEGKSGVARGGGRPAEKERRAEGAGDRGTKSAGGLLGVI